MAMQKLKKPKKKNMEWVNGNIRKLNKVFFGDTVCMSVRKANGVPMSKSIIINFSARKAGMTIVSRAISRWAVQLGTGSGLITKN